MSSLNYLPPRQSRAVSVTGSQFTVYICSDVYGMYRSGTVNSNTVNSKFNQFEGDLTGVLFEVSLI